MIARPLPAMMTLPEQGRGDLVNAWAHAAEIEAKIRRSETSIP